MFHDILFLIIGLVLLVAGANFMTDGATTVAKRFKVSNLMIGLTVVALGSSMPDVVVCVESALEGKTAIAVGSVVGANVFDLLLVVGLMGVIRPWRVSDVMRRQDLPILAIASIALWMVGDTIIFDGAPHNIINRSSGLMLLVIFAFYMWLMVLSVRDKSLTAPDSATTVSSAPSPAKVGTVTSGNSDEHGIVHSAFLRAEVYTAESALNRWSKTLWGASVMILAGLAGLVIGGNWVVDGAGGLALKAGMSQGLVALTVVAIGNSLPDLTTSLTATLKGNSGIALGNIVGACIINALLAIGLSATIRPLGADTIGFVDFITLAGASLLLWLLPYMDRNRRIGRPAGILLIALYIAYMVFTIIRG